MKEFFKGNSAPLSGTGHTTNNDHNEAVWINTQPLGIAVEKQGKAELELLSDSLLHKMDIHELIEELKDYSHIELTDGTFISGAMLGAFITQELHGTPVVEIDSLNYKKIPGLKQHILNLITTSKQHMQQADVKELTSESEPWALDEHLVNREKFTFEERHASHVDGLTDSHYKEYIANREKGAAHKDVTKNSVKRSKSSTFFGRLKGMFGTKKENNILDDFNKENNILDDFNIEGNFINGEKIVDETLTETKAVEDTLHTSWLKENRLGHSKTNTPEGFVDDMHKAHIARVASGEYKPIVRPDVVDDDFPARGFLYQEPTKPKIDLDQKPFEDKLHTDYISREEFQKAREQEFLSKIPSKKNKKTKSGLKSLVSRLINKKDEKVEDVEEIVESRFPNHEVFLDSLYNDDPTHHIENKNNILEKQEEAKRKLEIVEKKTKSIREGVIEKLGLKGETFLSLCDKGSEFFGKNVSWQTKVFASAGLITAGALSASAGPVVLTSIGLMSLAMRSISTAGTYLAVRGILEKNYEAREKAGKKVSSLEKGVYGAGAVIIAAGAGHAIGYLFEQLATAAEKGLTSAKDLLDMPTTIIPETIPTEVITEVVPVAQVAAESAQAVSPEIITPAMEMLHTVTRNENLWSVVRKSLESIDYEGFSHLSRGVQEAKISILVDKIAQDPRAFGVMSGKIDIIRPGETINLTKLFTK